MRDILIIGAVVLGVLGLLPFIVSTFLRDVEAGTIRLVSWLHGSTAVYRGGGHRAGPGANKTGVVEAAMVWVGYTDTMIKTAANRYSAKPMADQLNTLT